MTEKTELVRKRDELNHQLITGQYNTLVDRILDGTGRLIQKLVRSSKPEPPSFWYSALLLGLIVSSLIDFIALLLNENSETMPHVFNLDGILFGNTLVWAAVAVLIITKLNVRIIFSTVCANLLDAIELETDLVDLQGGLATFSDIKKPISVGLAFSVLVGSYGVIAVSTTRGGFVGIAVSILVLTVCFPYGLGLYYFFPYMALLLRISRYQYRLYAVDPRSSEIVDRLSDMGSAIVYVIGVVAAITCLAIAFFGFLTPGTIITLILGVWAPIIAFFGITQYTLTKIITEAKRKKLNEIEARIERLEAEENIEDKETMETIKRLIEYHNLIKGTPNSALNIRASLNFLNSLLLPVLAFLLANLDKIFELF